MAELGDDDLTDERRQTLNARLDDYLSNATTLREEISDAVAPLEILGPSHVLDAFNKMTETFALDDDETTTSANEAFILAVRTTLSVKG